MDTCPTPLALTLFLPGADSNECSALIPSGRVLPDIILIYIDFETDARDGGDGG
jgi:hypothetical protein